MHAASVWQASGEVPEVPRIAPPPGTAPVSRPARDRDDGRRKQRKRPKPKSEEPPERDEERDGPKGGQVDIRA